MKKPTMTRRKFLAASSMAIAAPVVIPGSALGKNSAVAANERINIAAIGIGGRMRWMFPFWLGSKQAQVVAVCDCWESRLAQGRSIVNGHYRNNDCATYSQIPEVLERDDIDGVVIATGDRMHTPATIMAARAGKDVYCEKPHSMTIAEGRAMVDACERLGTVYQCGHQRHSVEANRMLSRALRHPWALS